MNMFLVLFQLNNLPLKEMYCEENPLLQHIPVHSVQEEEVLSLKVCVHKRIRYFSIYPSTRYRKRRFYHSRFVFIRESDTSAYTRPLGTGRGSSIPQGLFLYLPVHSVQEEEVLSLKVCIHKRIRYFSTYPSTRYRKRRFYHSRFVFIRESDTSAYTRPLCTGRGGSITQGLFLYLPVHSVQEEEVLSLKVCIHYFSTYPSTRYKKRRFYHSRFVFIRESDTSAHTCPLCTGRGGSITQGLYS